MSFDLRGVGGGLSFAQGTWPTVLRLAHTYGWKPQGTILDEESGSTLDGEWSGSYEFNDGQLVTAEDASNLADAMERALSHFPLPDENETVQYQLKANLK